QKRSHLEMMEHHVGIPGRLVRPLSAKLLSPTLPEQEGMLYRNRLYGIHGNGRRKIRELAKKFGLTGSERHGRRCRLVDPGYGDRLRKMLISQLPASLIAPALFEIRRHVWVEDRGVIVVGRNQIENQSLTVLFSQLSDQPKVTLATPTNFNGPTLLAIGLEREKG
ncbi:MAG: hypothetical protein ACIALR_08210, partial [Blastopirellula sp. JB062]